MSDYIPGKEPEKLVWLLLFACVSAEDRGNEGRRRVKYEG